MAKGISSTKATQLKPEPINGLPEELKFIEQLITVENPHGSGDVSRQIVDQLMVYPLDKILKKSFFDLPIDSNSA